MGFLQPKKIKDEEKIRIHQVQMIWIHVSLQVKLQKLWSNRDSLAMQPSLCASSFRHFTLRSSAEQTCGGRRCKVRPSEMRLILGIGCIRGHSSWSIGVCSTDPVALGRWYSLILETFDICPIAKLKWIYTDCKLLTCTSLAMPSRCFAEWRSGIWRYPGRALHSPSFVGCPSGSRLRCHPPSATRHPWRWNEFSCFCVSVKGFSIDQFSVFQWPEVAWLLPCCKWDQHLRDNLMIIVTEILMDWMIGWLQTSTHADCNQQPASRGSRLLNAEKLQPLQLMAVQFHFGHLSSVQTIVWRDLPSYMTWHDMTWQWLFQYFMLKSCSGCQCIAWDTSALWCLQQQIDNCKVSLICFRLTHVRFTLGLSE